MKLGKSLIGGIVVTAAIVLGTAAPALAANSNYNVSGTLNCVGAMAQYGTYRPHSSGGASMNLTGTSWFANSDSIRIGLRDMGDTQITQSLEWAKTARGVKYFRTASSGSATIPTGSYAINARLVTSSTGCGFAVPSWTGTLNQ